MNKAVLFLHPFLLLSYFIFGCGQPTDFDGKLVAHNPNELIASLSQAYEEKNLEGYLSLFDEDAQFLSGGDYLWGKAREQEIHQRLFAAAKTIELSLTEGWNEEATETNRRTVYHYYLQVQLPGTESLVAQGQVELGLAKTSSDVWQIKSFGDLKAGSQKSTSATSSAPIINNTADYLPLRVGNTWVYKNTAIEQPQILQTTITDSLIINGKLFYNIENFLYISGYPNRVDSGLLKTFVEKDSSELTVLDFNAAFGDTLLFTPPDLEYPMIVELLWERDSVTVPAGTFFNVKEFVITDVNSGSLFFYEFAESVGIIRQRHGTLTVNELISAQVNGRLIVSVESLDHSWTEIKSRY
jgi:hypothetical protein